MFIFIFYFYFNNRGKRAAEEENREIGGDGKIGCGRVRQLITYSRKKSGEKCILRPLPSFCDFALTDEPQSAILNTAAGKAMPVDYIKKFPIFRGKKE